MALTSNRGIAPNADERQHWIFVLDRGSLKKVSFGEWAGDAEPAWSPDGRRLAVSFNEVHFGGVPFTVMNADGTGRREVAPGDDPAWSPGGELIAYYSDIPTEVGVEGLYVIRPDGSGKRRLAGGREPSWSPDGSQIAFSAGPIYVVNRDGTGLRQVTSGPFDAGPAWSPDGRQIAFSQYGTPDADIWAIAPDGSGLRNLTNTPTVREANPDWQRRPELPEFALPGGAKGCGEKFVDDNDPITLPDLIGGPLDDLLFARAGNDDVRGLGGNDILFGGSGNDRVLGGSGEDTIAAGSGKDVVGARDGEIDQIKCGPGRDRAVVDRRDRVARDCERISRH